MAGFDAETAPADITTNFNYFLSLFPTESGYKFELMNHNRGLFSLDDEPEKEGPIVYTKWTDNYSYTNKPVQLPDPVNFGKTPGNIGEIGQFLPNPPYPMSNAQISGFLDTFTTPGDRFIYIEKDGNRHYFYFNKDEQCAGGCQKCYNKLEQSCLVCHSWATIDWINDADAKKKGRCLCQVGVPNAENSACDASGCHQSCKSCKGPGADQCFTCAAGHTEGTRGDGGTFNACTSTCHTSCATCSGPHANQCLTCADWSDNGATLTKSGTKCLCPADKYQDGVNRRCENCPDGCSSCIGPLADACTGCINNSDYQLVGGGSSGVGTCQRICYPSCAVGQCSESNNPAKCTSCVNNSDFKFIVGGTPGVGTCQRICDSSCAVGQCSESNNPAKCTGCINNSDYELIVGGTPGEGTCRRICHNTCGVGMCSESNDAAKCTGCINN